MKQIKTQRQHSKPIRRSMLIFREPTSPDKSRTLYENLDKENSRPFHVFALCNRACFHLSFKRKHPIVHSSEIIFISANSKLRRQHPTPSDSSSWEVHSHKPHWRKKETDTKLSSHIRRGIKMPKDTKYVQW